MRPRAYALWAAAAAALPFCLIPVSDPDLPWHLSAGRWIAAHGAVPRADFLSWSMAGAPWIDFEWAAQLVFYGLHRLGGFAALWAFKSAWVCGLLLAWYALLRAWTVPALWAAAALPACALGLSPSVDARPELFTFALALGQLAALESLRRGRAAPTRAALAAHVALYALWANLHAGFALGLGLIALFAAGRAVDALLAGERPGAAARAAAQAPEGLLLAAAAAGTVLNPYGVGVHRVLLLHGRDAAVLARHIQEWTRPALHNPYQAAYWALVPVCFGLVLIALRAGRRVPGAHLLVLSAVALAGSRSFRFVPYLPLLGLPLALAAAAPVKAGARTRRAAAAGLAAAALFLFWGGARVLRSERPLSAFARTERTDPRGAVEFLRREKAVLGGLRLFNPWDWGGTLGWKLWPDYPVFVDGRYLFAPLLPELAAAEAGPQAWRDLLDRRAVDLALLEGPQPLVKPRGVEGAPWRPYTAESMPSREWGVVYWDARTTVFVRRAAVPPIWLDAREYRHFRPLDLQRTSLVVIAGAQSAKDVRREVLRHIREARDPRESPVLTRWLAGLERESAAR